MKRRTRRSGRQYCHTIFRLLVRPGGWLALAVLCALIPGSCTGRGTEVESPVELPREFSKQGQEPLPHKWWTAFCDERLDALVADALRGNFGIRQAWDRLDQARAAAAKAGAPLWPSLDGTAGAGRNVSHTPAGGTQGINEFSLGLAVSYEVDFWGRVRSAHDAALLDVSATEQDLQAAATTLSADIARTWFRLAEQQAQLKLVGRQVQTNETYLQAITLQFRRGQIGATDVLQQRQLVESTRGDQVQVRSGVEVLAHQLAVLAGRPPSSVEGAAPDALPELPPLPSAGVPADWVRRRPDVRAAEARVRAADRRLAAAMADRLPRLSLTLNASTTAEEIRDLFDNWMASIAANLVAPLFDAGERQAEVERTRAVVSEAVNAYGQTVLTALQEVEDALVQEARQAEYVRSLGEQFELSRQAKDRTLANYRKGAAGFTRYLTTLQSYQQLQRSHLRARRDLLLFRIDLYRALAGGWELPRPPRAELTQSD